VNRARTNSVSHRVTRICLWSFGFILASAIALRVEAAIYARRIVSVVSALSTLRVEETSKVETLRRISALHPSKTGPYGAPVCDADECFSGNIQNRVIWRTEDGVLADVLCWWGFRTETLSVFVNFKSGKVSSFAYHLMVLTPMPASVPPPPREKLGAVVVGLQSQRMITVTVSDPSSVIETHPPYRLSPSRWVPAQIIGISLTPEAPDEVVRAAFDLRLHCVWSLEGCHRWSDLLPSVEALAK